MEDQFLFCLEAVADVAMEHESAALKQLTELAQRCGMSSIYKTCDTIEGFTESLELLLYDDHQFKNYEIIYLVVKGQANLIQLNGYQYSLGEIAELFEGKLKGKILHFANGKTLDLTPDEAQYLLDVTGAKAVSGYGISSQTLSSGVLDQHFFALFEESDDVIEIVKTLHQQHDAMCKLFDFRLYY